MTTSTFRSIDFLPDYLQTSKNSKFLSSTLDQLIQPAQIERINGYVGTRVTPTYSSTSDNYIPDTRNYQIAPALIINNSDNDVQDVISYDDLYNEIATRGGNISNLDRLFNGNIHAYDPHIDWDKLINYQEYFWLVTGPDPILIIDDSLIVESDIIGNGLYTFVSNENTISLSNGMIVTFSGLLISEEYQNKQFFVEGVGTSIKLVDYTSLATPGIISTIYNENFDSDNFDDFPFDGDKTLPITPEYITINRSSSDLNPWSRYNRWVHRDVIAATAIANNVQAEYPSEYRAARPIIEFVPDLKLFNFGTSAINNVDYIDTITTDAFSIVEGSAGYYIDGELIQEGHRVIFNADPDPLVTGRIFRVSFQDYKGNSRLVLTPAYDNIPSLDNSVNILKGKKYSGTCWQFNGTNWIYAQQHTKINQPPLFDLFDTDGVSYSEYVSDFTGNKIFSYAIGTTPVDSILGLSLDFKTPFQGIGSYLFSNHFNSEVITITAGSSNVAVPTANTYCKIGNLFKNVWTSVTDYSVPILQFQTTESSVSNIEISSLNNSALSNFDIDVSINFKKIDSTEYAITTNGNSSYVSFLNSIPKGSNVLFKIYSDQSPNDLGTYELPVSLTNNPLNSGINKVTLTELQDHVKSMIEKSPKFYGVFPGVSNLRDISNISNYGTRLIANSTPIAFPQLFLGKKEHSVIDALTKASNDYNQFKLGFLQKLISIDNQLDSATAVDAILLDMNLSKQVLDSYYLSDMIPYGTNTVIRKWTVTDSRNILYSLIEDFNPAVLSMQAVLVYINGVQLLYGIDYTFVYSNSKIKLFKTLVKDDILIVKYYPDTTGSYVPATPTKLGLYPKFKPSIYTDSSYTTETKVIQGHDGSITLAYNDYRDDIILEFEKRIYNNIKVQYRSDLFDHNSILPGAFRNSKYSLKEITDILREDFINWSGTYGIDVTTNSTFNEDNPFTWNYLKTYCNFTDSEINGHWRAIYKYFYDTDRPNTHPWEMLGLTEKPDWWNSKYGDAPYTSGNTLMWNDIEDGKVNGVINSIYSRPRLNQIIPVDDSGNLLNPSEFLLSDYTPFTIRQSWEFGNHSPAETAWRRSSFWPFALQKLMALVAPLHYTSLMYDVSRMVKNKSDQWTYGSNNEFLNIQTVVIPENINTLTAGYSVYIKENGLRRSLNYISEIKSDIKYFTYNLFHKVGGFVSKNSLEITIDAIDPVSSGPGALLSKDDYSLILNVSNPIKTISISGLIVQKYNGNYLIKGYDLTNPYFNYYKPIRNSNSPTINIGGVSSPYVTWTASSTAGNTGLNISETTTAQSSPTSIFYNQGQIVKYENSFYIVKSSHRSESSFNLAYYQKLPSLPLTGGATVQVATNLDKSKTFSMSYGTELTNIQDVYDLIVGYGSWLTSQGFVFDDFNNDFEESIDWNFSAKEFLFWTTQNWANNNIITLSPFANKLTYGYPQSVVNNIFDSFYDYKILNSSGNIIPKNKISVYRNSGLCTINMDTTAIEGIYFATFRSVQKEHGIIFNNTSIFKEVIYSLDTGFYQQRMALTGFRTSNWAGDYFSPGFIYDTAVITKWQQYTDYRAGTSVFYSGNYYSATKNLSGAESFNFNEWKLLNNKPQSGLFPNFDYKITQFSDFYNLDINNFDDGQKKLAQHLTGYTPRPYLNNIIIDPAAQYKFYQGFIKEKGTQNSIYKLSKSTTNNYQGNFTYNEEWAFRIGKYGSFTTYRELEVLLEEGTFVDNPQVLVFSEKNPENTTNNLNYYSTASTWQIIPDNYISSETFPLSTGTYLDNEFILPTAGYVRIDDVDYTVVTSENLINSIINSGVSFNEGDTVWIGFSPSKGWDVVRYTLCDATIIAASINDSGTAIDIITDKYHNISVNDIISIVGYDATIDGIYVVNQVPTNNSFSFASSVTFINYTEGLTGNLFRFSSSRYNTFDNLPDNKQLLNLPEGSKIWIDNDDTGKWAVYSKQNNYYAPFETASTVNSSNQKLGWSISKSEGSNLVVVGSPGFVSSGEYGKVSLYTVNDKNIYSEFFFYLDEFSSTTSHSLTNSAEFGYFVIYDDTPFLNTNRGLVFASAPSAATTTTAVESGLIKISALDFDTSRAIEQLIIPNPTPVDYSRFGSSMYVQKNTATNKLLLVGAPGILTNGTGTVYSYKINLTATVTSTLLSTIIIPNTTLGTQWGYSISGSDNGSIVAISALGNSNTQGFVRIYSYNGSTLTFKQQINSPCISSSQFGYKALVSSDGTYLFVSAPRNVNYDNTLGVVLIYKNVNGTFVFDQNITNPVATEGLQFGIDIDVNTTNDSLIISTLGSGVRVIVGFDTDIIFDSEATSFYDTINNSGVVYLYNRYNQRFVVSQEIDTVAMVDGTNFGRGIVIDSAGILIGAPAYDNLSIQSKIYYFDKIDTSDKGWNKLRYQDDLIKLDSVERIMLVDTLSESVLNYLDIIDPLKGRISGIADQEISYKLVGDPAVYSIGFDTTTINVNSNWTDDHVGELWWDIGTVKYQWYEQGDFNFRKTYWGALFPGSSIDIYEWVQTTLLPSEWSAIADTENGLVYGISGQPLYADDTVYSVKVSYDENTNTFSNRIYYYWVKNSALVPNVKNRRISALDVSSLINDPKSYGLQFASPISKDSILLSNIAGSLNDKNINLNIALDLYNNKIPKHTEWVLLHEGSNIAPPKIIETKLIDSLLGRDNLGNIVPDPKLSPRNKYGIEFRPRQSIFKDRISALRDLLGYVNTIFSDNIITGIYNFNNLNTSEPIPDESANLYDLIVEDIDELLTVDTSNLVAAELTCTVQNGKIRSVSVVNAGSGYLKPPTVIIKSTSGKDGKILTEIDNFGKVISAIIDNPGNGYVNIPLLITRPFTVIVMSDVTFTGKWARYEYDMSISEWERRHTQSYNTPLYWNYSDWVSKTYNPYKDYTLTVTYPSDTEGLLLSVGDYVRVKNNGLNNYIILEYVYSNGNYSNNYNIVYSENGTIQLSDNLWDRILNPNYYDSPDSTYDQTLYDQTPDLELSYIITALRDDLFINNLKSYWNLFFFKAVKYAYTEQKLLDWAFKTSFISITNDAGNLGQPAVYKLTSSTNFENYIKEVKPFHTQLRNFTESYSILDPSNSSITDFELLTSETDILTNPVRHMNIMLKFDRISELQDNKDLEVTDEFACNGYANSFELSWLAHPDKKRMTVTLNGLRVYWADYTIKYYTKQHNGYTKKVCKIVFLNYVPPGQKLLKISYIKNSEVLAATDRIFNFYSPLDGSPGLELDQLMTGIKYPKNEITSLPFDYSTNWSVAPYDGSTWGSDYGYYAATTTKSTASVGTSTLSLSTTTGIKVGYYINVVSTTTHPFVATSPTVTNITGTTITFSSTLKDKLSPGSKIEFWSLDSSLSVLDSEIIGGDLGYTKAVGTGTTDIIIDGYSLYNADAEQAPEELVPGGVMESLGINVYTKNPQGPPAVYSGIIEVNAFTITTATLRILPQSSAGIIVSSGKQQFTYVSNTTTSTVSILPAQYTIDWDTGNLTLNSSYPGIVSYTIIGVGGGSGNDAGVIDYTKIVTSETAAQLVSDTDMNSVGSVYVTVNGQAISQLTTSTNFGYVLSKFNENDNRASVIVYNMPYVYNENTVQAWFFASQFNYFNEIKEQIIPVIDGQSSYTLTYPPSSIGPDSAQVIVEIVNAAGVRFLLTPPDISYYQVTNIASPTFRINNRIERPSGFYSYNNAKAIVFVNGIKQRPGFDYTLNAAIINPTITLLLPKLGDVVAIEDRLDSYDFIIDYDKIYINPIINTNIIVTTFANQDDMLMRTERFTGTQSGRYQLSRPILNVNCIWIWRNGKSLSPTVDYAILSDKLTIQLSDSIVPADSDNIVIMSISDQNLAATTIGYRIFNDMFGRTNFKRLSAENSTYLTKPLFYTDSEIYLNDASTIIPPNPFNNIPGVVIIAGERIEFTKKVGNVLSQLRRATLGTGAKRYSEIYTKVIDQSPDQTIPYAETILKQVQFTTSTSKVYTISNTTSTVQLPYSSSKLVSDGIILSTSTNISANNQVQVFYGGRLLHKTGNYQQDTNKAYDSPEFTLIGTVQSTANLPATPAISYAYVDNSTNQVWVYTNSLSNSSINGYEYTGLKYQPPEFVINTSTQEITLNIQEGIGDNIKLVIVKKQLNPADLWNNGVSLLNSDSSSAKFLQSRPAELPDMYYYGGDPTLTTGAGFALTDINNDPLEGL